MSFRRSMEQLRPARIESTNYVDKVQYLLEEIQFPKDIFDGFEFTQTAGKTDRAAVKIRVSSADRDSDRDEILRRLKNADIMANLKSTNSSVDPIVGEIDGTKFVINVKPKSGGMGESTLNASITELFPCIAFEKKLHPKNYIDFMEKIMAVDLSTLNCIGKSDMKAAQETVNKAESSSKYQEKMENALGILDFINDQHTDKPIKQVYWGYRTKPTGVPKGHPGDMFIEYQDKRMLGVSLKAGGKKTKEPQLNTYHKALFVNQRGGPDFNDKRGLQALTKMVYSQVYSKIKGVPPLATFDNKDKSKTAKLIDKLPRKKADDMYNQYLEIVRQGLIKRFNKNKAQSLKYIKDAILREAPDVPTIVIKAIDSGYEEVTDRDELGVFLPQVQFVKAKVSRTSKQNFLLELKSRNETITLLMTTRSSSGGKLKQWSLKVTYNGIEK
tara:strand:+ start:9 stop:1334 length:1326 start_codon:yes stop_codon:yes gene_type:complete